MYLKRNDELDIISLYTGDYSARFYLRQISKLTNLPLKTCQNILLNLEKRNILKSSIEGKNKYFILNLNNINTKLILNHTELRKTEIFLNKYPEFKSVLKEFKDNVPIILFGSFAKLNANKNSDLDLLIISEKKGLLPLHLITRKVHEINLSESSFLKLIEEKETLIKEIQENHIVLNNHSFYINTLWRLYEKKD